MSILHSILSLITKRHHIIAIALICYNKKYVIVKLVLISSKLLSYHHICFHIIILIITSSYLLSYHQIIKLFIASSKLLLYYHTIIIWIVNCYLMWCKLWIVDYELEIIILVVLIINVCHYIVVIYRFS